MAAPLVVQTLSSIDEVPEAAYDDLMARAAAPAYYDRRFLRAAERSPLLPSCGTGYVTASRGDELLAFMPVYCQAVRTADPFGLLMQKTSATFAPDDRGLFSHIMHCCDTRLLVRDDDPTLYRAIFEQLQSVAESCGAPHFAILNVSDPALLAGARTMGLEISHVVDRFVLDLTGLHAVEDVDRLMPPDGNREMRRQRRKFEASNARVVVETPPFPNLEEVGMLCHETTARRGTPDYIPAAALARFLPICGDLVRLLSVYVDGRRVSCCILLLEKDVLHFWLGGLTYDDGFSPYAISVDTLFAYGLAQGCKRIEAGRLNARVKERFGFSPRPLYALVNPVPFPRARIDAVREETTDNARPRHALAMRRRLAGPSDVPHARTQWEGP